MLYIDDVTDVLKSANIKMYADDIVIYYAHKDIDRIVDIMNSETDKFKQWVHENKTDCKP